MGLLLALVLLLIGGLNRVVPYKRSLLGTIDISLSLSLASLHLF